MWLETWMQTMNDSRRSLLWWAVGIALYTVMLLAFFPLLKGNTAINDLMQSLPESLRALAGDNLGTPAGYVGGKLLSMMPILLTIFAALQGASLIAGQEERGWLEFPLAQPLPRVALLLGRAAALLSMLMVLGAVLFLSIWLAGQVFQAPLPAGRLLGAVVLHTLGAWLFGALALAIGAATGRSGLAVGVGAGLGTGLVVVQSVASQIPVLNDLAWLNPWKYALSDLPLENAISLTPPLISLVLGAALVWIAAPLLGNRDVRG
ncbi:ABC transporter permease subunit [Deinococcus frigens]|uniref:ABC transporter permease subunit n=1 Tax=Deinococcus frigens TaxID=249403 RepID=UPI0004961843|nr:ABC transporter permease subunit [Deinococcus frigens]